jgi:hypothetical protein
VNKYLADAATFPRDARQAWRNDGAHGVWSEIAERTVYRVVRTAHFDLYERDLAGVKHVQAPEGLDVRMLLPEEHAKLGALMTSRRRAHLGRNPGGRTVFAALRDEIVVGYSWWSSSIDSVFDFSPLTLPADAVFHGFVHVARGERHRGTANALFSAGEGYFHQRGMRTCWFLMSSTNIVGARTARARWGGRSRHIARLSHRKLPFHMSRTLSITDRS